MSKMANKTGTKSKVTITVKETHEDPQDFADLKDLLVDISSDVDNLADDIESIVEEEKQQALDSIDEAVGKLIEARNFIEEYKP